MSRFIDVSSTVDHGRVSLDIHAVGPILEALVREHGFITVVDEITVMGQHCGVSVFAALVQLCGFEDVVAAVVAARAADRSTLAAQNVEPF